jgi:hypothetical protein
VWDFSFPWGIMRFTHATLLHEPQNTGLALHYASELARFRYYVHYVHYDSHGGTNENKSKGLFFYFHGELQTMCAQLRCTNPRTLGWRFAI